MLLSTLSICCRKYKLFPCYLSCCLWTPTNRDRDPGTACADVQGWERSITAPHCTCSPSWLGGESSASALLSTVRRTNILPWETLLPPPLQPARHLKRWPLELADVKEGEVDAAPFVTRSLVPAHLLLDSTQGMLMESKGNGSSCFAEEMSLYPDFCKKLWEAN